MMNAAGEFLFVERWPPAAAARGLWLLPRQHLKNSSVRLTFRDDEYRMPPPHARLPRVDARRRAQANDAAPL